MVVEFYTCTHKHTHTHRYEELMGQKRGLEKDVVNRDEAIGRLKKMINNNKNKIERKKFN